MFTKKLLNKISIALFSLLYIIPSNVFAVDTPYVINNKCVSRVLSFSANASKPENGILVTPSMGYVNVYVLSGSDFSYVTQDVSGKLLKSPSQAFYYDYRGSSIIPAVYQGYDFAGNTNYLSLGSATLIQDVSYTCNGGAGTILAQAGIVPTYNVKVNISTPGYSYAGSATGQGTYKKGSNITVSVPHISGYTFDRWTGTCNLSSFYLNNYSTKSVYYYLISNLIGDCNITANYVRVELVMSTLYHHIELSTSGHGIVTLSGQNTTNVLNSSVASTVRDGDTVAYSVTPDSGYSFTGWSGSLYNYPASGYINSDRDKVAQATFTANSLTSSTTATCVDVPSAITITTLPYGSGAIHVDYPASLNYTGGAILTSLQLGNTYSGSNGNSCTNGFLIEPRAFSGYSFTGWSGDSNVATGTLQNLSADNRLRKGDWVTGNKIITANFTYTGVANNNGEIPVSVVEPVFNPTSDTVAQLFDFTQNTISRSPYTIDNKCVNRVLSFEGTRVVSDGTGFLGFVTKWIPVQILNPFTSPTHTYTIYSLEGSTLTQSQDTGLVTFKSSPSNFIYGYDVPVMKAGQYQSSNQNFFTGQSDTYTFKNFHKISFNAYDCSSGNDSLSVRESLILPTNTDSNESLPIFKGFNYVTPAYLSFVDCTTNCRADGGVYNPFNGHNSETFSTSTKLFNNDVLNGSYYSVVDCTAGYVQSNNDLGCPGWLYDYNISLFSDFRYIWVISTQPVKHLLHRQLGNVNCNPAIPSTCGVMQSNITDNFNTDYLQFDVDKVAKIATTTLLNPFTGISSIESLYISRININNCVPYSGLFSYGNKIINAIANFFDKSSCPKIISSPYLNSLVFDSISSHPNVVYNFGMLLTSKATDYSTYSASKIATDILGSIYDPATGGSAPVDSNGVPIGGNKNVPTSIKVLNKSDVKTEKSYTSPIYSAPVNETLDGKVGYSEGYSSALANVTSYMNNTYDINQCFIFHATSTSILSDMGCVLKNATMQILTTLVIPSSNNLKSLQENLFATSSPSSLFSSALAIPFKFSNWANLNWYPNWSYSQYASSTYVPQPGYNIYTATSTTYVATSTTPGHYDYVATSTIYINATSTFTSSGTFTSPIAQNIWVVMSGGGAGGANGNYAGGGSAGQFISTSTFPVSASSYSIVIGAGGSTNTGGGDTTFSTLTAVGGKTGGTTAQNGVNGYNGGGASSGSYTGGTGTNYAGGNGGTSSAGGGSGSCGAGGNGVSASWNGGQGGIGCSSTISGTLTYYSAGGSGSGQNGGYNGRASGIGGVGGTNVGNASNAIGYGSGGGGGSGGNLSGSGSSGIVIIVSSVATSSPGYYVYVATSTTNGYYLTVGGFNTYVATSSTIGNFVTNFNVGTTTMPYLTVGFSSSTRYNIIPATAGDLISSKYAVADKMLFDWLSPFIQFIFILFISWRAYKMIIL